MYLQLFWHVPTNKDLYYKYAFVQLDRQEAQTLFDRINELTKLKMSGSDAAGIVYYDRTPLFLPAPGQICALKDVKTGESFHANTEFGVAVSRIPLDIEGSDTPGTNHTALELYVTHAGCYWAGYTLPGREYIKTGYLDQSYLRQFINGKLQYEQANTSEQV